MEFLVLGPLAVLHDGEPVELGGAKQRALLAILLLHANEAVSRDRLIEGIWGEALPAHPDRSLDTYVSRLRKALGAGRIERSHGGYCVRVAEEELDLAEFERHASAGRHAEALDLWRGPALADLLFEPFAAWHAPLLEERRLTVLEDHVDDVLAGGAGGALVTELEALVRENPLRERLTGQLMLALYRSGRQAAALDAYTRARRELSEALGLEPSPQLQDLQRSILTHDRSLGPHGPSRRVSRRRRRTLVAIGVAMCAATAVSLVVATRHQSASGAAASARLVAFDPAGRQLIASPSVSGAPAALAVERGSLWAADPNGERVLRLDARTGRVTDRIPVAAQPSAIAVGTDAVWVASAVGGLVTRIDPTTDRPTRTLRLGGANPSSLVLVDGRLWIADLTDRTLVEVDPASGAIERTIRLDLAPTALAAGGGEIWAAGYNAGAVDEVDVASGEVVARLPVGQGPSALVYATGSLWVANALDGTLTQIDATTDRTLATVEVGSGPTALAAIDDSIWVASEYSHTVTLVDAHTGRRRTALTVRGRPTTLAAADSRVWVGSAPIGETHRGGTLVLSGTNPPNSIDPAYLYYGSFQPSQLPRLVYDTLVTFDDEPGARGLRLVPDLALQLPVPTQGGTVYRFRIRRGVRYSTGRTVRPDDFRRAFERLFRLESPGRIFYDGIVGAAACREAPSSCDFSRGIVVDRTSRTVTFHLVAPDPDFLFKLTEYAFGAPIPAGAPDCCVEGPPPGTGPYRFANDDRFHLRLVRNLYFHEWSHAAQPAGKPDRILWVHAASHEAEVRDIQAGRADWSLDFVPVDRLRAIEQSTPSLLHVNPAYIVEYIPLNTRLRPFDSVDVRRALNLAIDRRAIARMYGGPLVATPLCQPLPPGMPGYVRYCPYTKRAGPDGVYHGPDLARARQLVARSGRRGDRVTVWGAASATAIPPELPRYVASVLRELGFRATVRTKVLDSITSDDRRSFQLSVDGDWLPDFPSAASFLPPFFACRGGHNDGGYYCDHQLDALMQRATRAGADDAEGAAALWTEADHRITDAAWWVPMVNIREVDLVSPRLRNYEFQPVWGFIADQAWVR